jgi:hypothetical protein
VPGTGFRWFLLAIAVGLPSSGSDKAVDLRSTLAARRQARFLSQGSEAAASGRDAPAVRHLTETFGASNWGGRINLGYCPRAVDQAALGAQGYDAGFIVPS